MPNMLAKNHAADTSGVLLAWIVILVTSIASARAEAPSGAARSIAPLNPSILLFHKPHHNNGVEQVRRAAQLGCRTVNVVVTLWCDIDEQRQVLSLGRLHKGKYRPLDDQLLAEFSEQLRLVFAAAVEHDLDLSILGHLNSGGKVEDWRNFFLFDPLVEYAGYSYQQAMIEPIVEALVATVGPQTRVEFSLTGEMGRSAFVYPESYVQLIDSLHQEPRLPDLELGLSFNFNRADGEHESTPEQLAGLNRLLQRCDFIGMSHYRWFELPIDRDDFVQAVDLFWKQFDLPGVEADRGKPMHFSEVGLGGGRDNGVPAETAQQAAKTPYRGCTDPATNPWRDPQLRQLRLDFHRALLEYLANQPPGTNLTEAFLWSEGSWDPMDIVDVGFADQEIIDLIRQHNDSAAVRK